LLCETISDIMGVESEAGRLELEQEIWDEDADRLFTY
jgi:hypothetical protein